VRATTVAKCGPQLRHVPAEKGVVFLESTHPAHQPVQSLPEPADQNVGRDGLSFVLGDVTRFLGEAPQCVVRAPDVRVAALGGVNASEKLRVPQLGATRRDAVVQVSKAPGPDGVFSLAAKFVFERPAFCFQRRELGIVREEGAE
jgi:hypothetical protein